MHLFKLRGQLLWTMLWLAIGLVLLKERNREIFVVTKTKGMVSLAVCKDFHIYLVKSKIEMEASATWILEK